MPPHDRVLPRGADADTFEHSPVGGVPSRSNLLIPPSSALPTSPSPVRP